MGYFDHIHEAKRQVEKPRAPQGLPVPQGQATAYAQAALSSEAEVVATTPNGRRNETLNKAWFRMGRHVGAGNIDAETVKATLADAGRACGLPDHEIATVLRDGPTSALSAGAEHPRHPDPSNAPEVPEVTVLGPDADTEANFWAARPILTHLHDFARARRVSPWAVLGVALARIVTATPHQVCLPAIVGGKSSLNMFIGLVGASGSGKGAAEAVAADAIDVGYIEVHTTGSGEGIAHGYMQRDKGNVVWRDDTHAVLFSVSEIDTLAAQGDRKGATLMPELRRGWSGERLGFGYADPAKRLPVPAHEYRMCMVAGIQPARAGCLIDDADGGTPQRFLWMPATDPDAPDVPPAEPRRLAWEAPPTGSLASVGGIPVAVCDLARHTIDAARLARLRGDGEALDGHALLARLKTAAALGIAEGRYSVTEEDWALAETIGAKSDAVRAGVQRALRAKFEAANYSRAEAEAERAVHVVEKVADAAIKRVCSVVVRKLRKEGEAVSRGALRRAVAGRDRDHFDAALERLEEAGQIVSEEGANGGRYDLTDR